MIGFVLAGEEICGSSEFGIGGFGQAGEGVAIHLAVADYFSGDVGFMVERGCGRGDVGSIDISCGGSRAAVTGGNAASVDTLDRGFRDGVGIVAEVVFDAIFAFADLVGPDGASILKMDDVGGRGKRQRKH